MKFRVDFTARAKNDLDRLFDFIVERELAVGDANLSLARRAMDAIAEACLVLERTPHLCRRCRGSPTARELVIDFGSEGYVALFDIVGGDRVIVISVRHQREQGYAPRVGAGVRADVRNGQD